MINPLRKCTLCPRNCQVNRYIETGYCKAKAKIKVALASVHMWEEPCISGVEPFSFHIVIWDVFTVKTIRLVKAMARKLV